MHFTASLTQMAVYKNMLINSTIDPSLTQMATYKNMLINSITDP